MLQGRYMVGHRSWVSASTPLRGSALTIVAKAVVGATGPELGLGLVGGLGMVLDFNRTEGVAVVLLPPVVSPGGGLGGRKRPPVN